MRKNKCIRVLLSGWSLLFCLSPQAHGAVLQDQFQKIVLTGDLVPSEGPGLSIADFAYPVINNNGDVVFGGVLSGPGTTRDNNNAIFIGGSGPTRVMIRQGAQAADAQPRTTHRTINHIQILNNAGTTGFGSFLTGNVNPGNDTALYLINRSGATELVREGDALPGEGPGYIVSGLNPYENLAYNHTGQSVFVGEFFGGSTGGSAVYTGTPGNIQVVAREGAQAPGGSPDLRFGAMNFIRNSNINNHGQIAFLSNLTGREADSSNDRGIYYYDTVSDILAEVARKGEQAPYATAGVTFLNIGSHAISDSGRVLYGALLAGPGVDATNDFAFYLAGPTSVSEIARTGDQALGVGPGIVYSELNKPVVNASEQAAFLAMLTGPGVDSSNESVIILTGLSGPSQIVRGGMSVPDAGPGVVFSRLSNPALNDSGQVVFTATLAGVGVDSTNDTAIYATDRNGDLVEIVRSGQTIDVNDDPLIDDSRVVASIDSFIPGNLNSGIGSGLNDTGQVVFTVEFTDQSRGTFISNRATVPEPGVGMFIGLSACLMMRRRRR